MIAHLAFSVIALGAGVGLPVVAGIVLALGWILVRLSSPALGAEFSPADRATL